MNTYTDKWTRYHDKPTDGIEPSSNNGWIYTAYASKVGLEIDKSKLWTCYQDSFKSEPVVHVTRSPGKDLPPLSRDEVLGICYLKVNKAINSWNFSPFPIPNLSISQLLTQALALVVVIPYYKRILGVDVKRYHFELAHRNYFWKNNLDQLYRFAFSVPLQDRYSILKWSGRFKFYRPDHLFYAGVSLIDRMGKASGIRYLKYGGEKNMKAMVKEFPVDHPIRVKVGL